VGLFRGFLAPFRGAIYVARERMWRHLVVPVLLNLALGAGTLIAAARFWHQDLEEMLAKSPIIGWIFVGVMTVIGGVVLFILLQPIMNAIFCDRLAEVVEKRVRGSAPSMPLLPSIGKALAHGLLKLVLYAIAMGVGLALTVTPLTGIGTLVGIGLGAIFLAYDGFDYPLSRRGATFAGKWAYLAKSPGLTLGYGLGSYVLYLVPLAFLVAPPFAAVGATLAYLEADSRKASGAAPLDKGAKLDPKPDAKKLGEKAAATAAQAGPEAGSRPGVQSN
jgi:CysZ protein